MKRVLWLGIGLAVGVLVYRAAARAAARYSVCRKSRYRLNAGTICSRTRRSNCRANSGVLSRTDGESNCDLFRTRSPAGEQHVGEIQTGNEQDCSSHRHEQRRDQSNGTIVFRLRA